MKTKTINMWGIEWDKEKLEKFKIEIKKAKEKEHAPVFGFEDHLFYVPYAEYLVRLLDKEFNKTNMYNYYISTENKESSSLVLN